MERRENNYAFIDSQNVYKGVRRDLGWSIDWARFRVYLKHKYDVTNAYLFIGFMPEHNDIYDELQKAGFILKFKPVLPEGEGGVKGNIDADLVLQAMIDYPKYDKAVIVSSDGDFYSLVRYLYGNQKLLAVLSPYRKTCSRLLRKSAKGQMVYMDTLKEKLAKRKSTAYGRNPYEVLFHMDNPIIANPQILSRVPIPIHFIGAEVPQSWTKSQNRNRIRIDYSSSELRL